MPPESTTETHFAFEGFLPLPVIVVLGVALVGLAWWLARHDSRVADRPRLVWVLWVFRCAALIVVLWMLAGPTRVTTVRTYKPKSVAILVDHSASMGLVDGLDGSGNVSRWSAARDGWGDEPVPVLDAASAALRAAQRHLERFARLPNASQNPAAAGKLLGLALEGLQQGSSLLRRGIGSLPDASGEVRRLLTDALAQGLDASALELLERKAGDLRRGKTLASLDRPAWLPDRIAALAILVDQVQQSADRLARALEEAEALKPSRIPAGESTVSRWDKAEAFLAGAESDWLKALRAKAVIHRYEFGDKVVPRGTGPWLSPGPAGASAARSRTNAASASTHLGAALRQVALDLETRPVEAAILITDGGHNAGRDPRELAPALASTALHIVPVGNTRLQRDVILHHTHAPKVVLQNDEVVVDGIVTAYDCEQETLAVELLEGGTVVDRQELRVTGEVLDSRVQFQWKAAKLGRHTLGLRVVPVSEERTEENNAARLDVQVMEDEIRVLVADNFPRWETRYLLNLFKRDERVVFDQLLYEPQRVAGPGFLSDLPGSLEEWSKYRIVILGDLLPRQLTPRHQELLREYVSQAGGNLILVAGRDAMPSAYLDQPLGSLLPVEPGPRPLPPHAPFYLHLTDEGLGTLATQIAETPDASERAWREMSLRLPVYSLSDCSKAKPTARSLIQAGPNKSAPDPTDPAVRSFLAWHYVGGGRVVYLAAPVVYQLRYRQGDTFHHRFWGQLLRWAIARDLAEGSQTVRLGTDKSRYEDGEPVQVTVRLRHLDGRAVGGADLRVAAWQEGARVQEVALREDPSRPGGYLGTLERLPVGAVRLQVSGSPIPALLAAEDYRQPIETTLHIDPSGQLELRHPLCNLALLREIADASGGFIVPPTGLKTALESLDLDPEVLENATRMPLWNRWDLFWIVIACLGLEWAGRKWIGLT